MSDALNTLTTEEAAQALGVTPSRVRQMIRSGQLPAKRFGKAHLILERDLDGVRERPIGRPPKEPHLRVKNAPQGTQGAGMRVLRRRVEGNECCTKP